MPTKWLQERTNGSKNEHGIPPHRGLRGFWRSSPSISKSCRDGGRRGSFAKHAASDGLRAESAAADGVSPLLLCLACHAATVLPALPNACITAKYMHSDGSVGMGEQEQRFQDMSDAIISRSKSSPSPFPAGLAILVPSAPRKGLRGSRGVEFGALNGSQRLSGA